MAYEQEISRKHKTCFLFLVDQSGSMEETWGANTNMKKADGVAEVLNRTLRGLCLRCAKGEEIRDYFDIGVIGYHGISVDSALGGDLEGQMLVSVPDLMQHPLKVVEREEANGQKIVFPIWVEPMFSGETPMRQTLNKAHGFLNNWIMSESNRDSYPPVVINITDGEPTDGDPTEAAEKIKSLSTNDGNVLLFNCHISSKAVSGGLFPSTNEGLPDEYARLLFSMSSLLPPKLINEAQNEGLQVDHKSRGFTFNSGFEQFVKFMDMGSR